MVTQFIANDAASTIFAELDARSIALAARRRRHADRYRAVADEVHVADDLRDSLARLSRATGGALALVSGRPIADLDRAVRAAQAAGDRRPWRRAAPARDEPTRSAPPLPPDLRRHLAAAATPGSGIIVEDKGYSLALHYRQAPQQEDRLRSHIAAGRAAYPGEATEVLPGKAMLEVKRPDVSKGDGVRELMQHPPFAGRMPVFIGDDVTDESVFAVLPELGRQGLFGRPAFRRARRHFRLADRRAPRLAAAGGRRRRERHDRIHARSCRHRQWAHRGAGRSDRDGSSGGACRATTAIRCSAGCSPATRKKASPTCVLDGQVEIRSEYMRNTAIVVTELTDGNGGAGAHHRFRAALPELRPHLPPAAARAHHRADRRHAAHHHPLPHRRIATACR